MLVYQICGDIQRMWFLGDAMRCLGKRGVGEANEIHCGGIKKVKEAVSGKKDSHKVICRNCTEENKNRFIKNKAKKEALSEMR